MGQFLSYFEELIIEIKFSQTMLKYLPVIHLIMLYSSVWKDEELSNNWENLFNLL